MTEMTRTDAVAAVDFGRLQGIQGMRAVAATGVMLMHLQWKLKQFYGVTMVPAVSNTAIDLFFMISGFVVALALRDLRMSPWHFFGRRIVRIYPTYFILTALAALVFLVRPEQVNSSGGTTNVLASFLIWPGPYKFLIENAWTLPHEFRFYALAMLAFFFRSGRQVVLAATIATVLLIEYLMDEPTGQQFVMIDFLTGIAAYHLSVMLASRGVRITRPAMIALPLALAVVVYTSVLGTLTSDRFLCVNVLWGICLVLVTLMDAGGCRSWLTTRLAAFGDRSYAIYLVHPFTLKLLFLLLPRGEHGPVFLAAAVAVGLLVSTAAGAAFYRYVEVPLRAALPR